MLQGRFPTNSLLDLFNLAFALGGLSYGLYHFVANGPLSLMRTIFGVSFYPLFPISLIIFSTLALFLYAKKTPNHLIILETVAAASFYDMLGSAVVGRHPDLALWVLWMIPIATCFILTKRRPLYFLVTAAFPYAIVFYLVWRLLWPTFILWIEPLEETIWIVFFLAWTRTSN